MIFWHGGIPGLRSGDEIAGGHSRRILDGCPICEARAVGGPTTIDPPTARPDHVYITTNRLYAKHYASLYGRGDLYRVEPLGDPAPSVEDSIPTWTVPSAQVVSVYDRAVLLTMTERRRLFREWGIADQHIPGTA